MVGVSFWNIHFLNILEANPSGKIEWVSDALSGFVLGSHWKSGTPPAGEQRIPAMDHSDSQKNQKFVNFTSFSDNLSHHPPSKRMGFDDGFGCFAYWHKKHPGNVKAQLQMISPCVILADNLSQDTAVVRGHAWFPNDPMFTAKESLQDFLQSHVHLSVAKTMWESNQKPQCHLCHRTWWTHDQWPKWIL